MQHLQSVGESSPPLEWWMCPFILEQHAEVQQGQKETEGESKLFNRHE